MLECSIFGHEGETAEDVVYVNWLTMVRAGLLGLEFYTPESKSWRQVCKNLSSKLLHFIGRNTLHDKMPKPLHNTKKYIKIPVFIVNWLQLSSMETF